MAERKETFYKPPYYELDREYKKYSEMLQKGEKDKTVYFRLGRINQYWENLDEAIMFYNKALEIDPDYGEVHYNLGNIYLQDGDLAGSKEHFLKATGENPEDIYAINALAKTYLKLGRFEKTLEQHKKALENNPYDLYALRGTGNVYLVRQNYQEALNYYYKALDINPFDGITLYNIGIIYLLSEKPEYARKHYLENLKKYDFSGFYFGLGLCLYKEGEKAEAYNCYREGIIKGEIPELDILFNIKRKEQVWNLLASQYHFCKASAFYSMSNLSKALEELEFTIEINPDFSEAYKFLGKVYFEKGDFSSALKNYEAFLELEEDLSVQKEVCELRLSLDPQDRDSLRKLHHIYWLNENFVKEIEILKKIVKISPKPPDLYKLGCAYLAESEKTQAEEIFNKLMAGKEKKELACIGLARVYSAKNDYWRALKYTQKAIDREEKWEYHIEAGNIYEKIDNRQKALDSYLEAFKINPWSMTVQNYYIDCLLEANFEEKASEIISELKEFPGYNLLLSLFYMKLEEYDKALKILSQIEVTVENEEIYRFYLGMCYYKKSHYERALEELGNIIQIEEFRGICYGLMALIYKELGNKQRLLKAIEDTFSFIRFTDPLLRCRLCILTWEEGLIEELEKFLPKALWSINFHPHFSTSSQKDRVIQKLNEIRERLIKEKRGKEDIPAAPLPARKSIVRKKKEESEIHKVQIDEEGKKGLASKEISFNEYEEPENLIKYPDSEKIVEKAQEEGLKIFDGVKSYFTKYDKKVDYVKLIGKSSAEEAKIALEDSHGDELEALKSIKQLTENKIDYICRKTGISREEAKRLLEEKMGDKIEAVKSLNRTGRDRKESAPFMEKEKLVFERARGENKYMPVHTAEKKDGITDLTALQLLSLEVGRNLLPLIDPNQGARLVERLDKLRRDILMETGIPLPSFHILDNSLLPPQIYIIKIRDIQIASGEFMINKFLAIGPEDKVNSLKGSGITEADYVMPAVWIGTEEKSRAEELGCMVIDSMSVMANHILEVLRKHMVEFLTRKETKAILDGVKETNPDLVKEVYPEHFTVGEVQKVLKNLIKENVPVKDMITILGTMGDYTCFRKDIFLLTEYVRKALSPFICKEYAKDKIIKAIKLSPETEGIISGSIKRDYFGSYLALVPSVEEALLSALEEERESFQGSVILCSPAIRSPLRRLLEKTFPALPVLATDEVVPEVKVEILETVALPEDIIEEEKKKSPIYYVEKMCYDPDPIIRCEGIKTLTHIVTEESMEKIYSFLEKGLKDEDSEVRLETAKAIGGLCEKKVISL